MLLNFGAYFLHQIFAFVEVLFLAHDQVPNVRYASPIFNVEKLECINYVLVQKGNDRCLEYLKIELLHIFDVVLGDGCRDRLQHQNDVDRVNKRAFRLQQKLAQKLLNQRTDLLLNLKLGNFFLTLFFFFFALVIEWVSLLF